MIKLYPICAIPLALLTSTGVGSGSDSELVEVAGSYTATLS